jgi:hypothetical protein
VKYQVIWTSTSTESLQAVYDAALDKQAVLNAVTRIGLELGAAPALAGESREPGIRILFKHPLIVWFHVNERLKNVVVLQARAQR